MDIPFGTIASWRHKQSQSCEQVEQREDTADEGELVEESSSGPMEDTAQEDEPAETSSGSPAAETESEQGSSHPEQTDQESGDGTSASEKVARRYTPSQKKQAIAYADEHGVSAAADKLGPTRQSIYRWIRQKERADRGEAEDPTEGPDPNAIKEQRDLEILNVWERHPGLGPSQLTAREEARERYESVRPNHLWHLDFVHRHIHAESAFTLILLDDHSRFVTGFGVDDAERVDTAIEVFE
ncbi:MAG: transposase, partial [Bradymonadaceae bacterium]